MDVIKIFFEEPVYLEALVADEHPDARRREEAMTPVDALLPGNFSEKRGPLSEDSDSPDALDRPAPAYRLYIAGTDLAADRVGATSIRQPGAWVKALMNALDGQEWLAVRAGAVEDVTPDEAGAILADPAGVTALAAAQGLPPAAPLAAAARLDRRAGVPRLLELLASGATVFFPEPAHHGADWSVYSPEPLKDALASALAKRQPGETRVFVVPYQQARGEHKFYFERWALEDLPDWVREIRPAGG